MKTQASRTVSALLFTLFAMQLPIRAALVFSDQAEFFNAAGQLQIEDFENTPLSGTEIDGALQTISFSFFSASSTPRAVKVFGSPLANGNRNTTQDGTNYLSFDTDVGNTSADAILNFTQAIVALGLFFVDTEQGVTVNINGLNYSVPSTGNGGQTYFGIIADSPFTTASFDAGSTDSHWSIDDVAVKPPPIPEPGTALFGFVLSALALCSRRRKVANSPRTKPNKGVADNCSEPWARHLTTHL